MSGPLPNPAILSGPASTIGDLDSVPPLVQVDNLAAVVSRRHQQQVAAILNSLIRAGVLSFDGVQEYVLTHVVGNRQNWPIGTPRSMSVGDAIDRLAERVKALE